MEIVTNLNEWFTIRLSSVRCSDNTKAYIVNVLSDASVLRDMSRDSLVIAYHDAKINVDFVKLQMLADWVLWVDSFCPASIRDNIGVTETIGQLSYYACHRLMRGRWVIFEELADNLPLIVDDIRRCVNLTGVKSHIKR